MDLGNINLNLVTLLYQQSVLFMQQLEKHTREVQEAILTKFMLPPDSDIEQSSSQEQSNEDVRDQEQIEAQEYNQEQRQKQMKYQLSNLKKARQDEGIHVGAPDLIDGIYLLKDKIRTPVYIKRDVQYNKIEKQRPKKHPNKGSARKQVKCTSKLKKLENNTEIQAKFEDKKSAKEKKTQQKNLEKSQTVESEDRIQIQQTSRQDKKLKIEKQKMEKTKQQNSTKPLKKATDQNQCLYCGKKFLQFVTLLGHEADYHGIVREKQLLSDKLPEHINEKNEKGQQEQIQGQEDINQIQKN